MFLKEEDGRYRRFDEVHEQRAWSEAEVRQAVEDAGMIWVAVYGDGTREAASEETERMYVIVREQGKML